MLETVIDIEKPNPTGVFFAEQKVVAINEALDKFEANLQLFTAENCHNNALKFSVEIFKHKFIQFVNNKMIDFSNASNYV